MPNPTATAPESVDQLEVCAICGRDTGHLAFCHIYGPGGRVVLCSPRCAEVFLHRSSTQINGYEEDPFAAAPAATDRWT